MRLVHGFGVNDADYAVRPIINGIGVMCPAYVAWANMLKRCHNERYQKKNKTYVGVTACDEWKSFMAFRDWWMEHKVDGWQLDKDILSDNRQYSPENCIYVPTWLNTFTVGRDAARGEWPIGVHYHKGRGLFEAMCKNPATGKRARIGLFKTPEAAHLAWRARKLEYAAQMKNEMDAIYERIYPSVVEIINRAK